jgi:Fur family transcriptional regulator, ferric uptake regulator
MRTTIKTVNVIKETSLEKQIAGRLQDRDVRLTSGRRTIVRSLSVADGPRSASDLYRVIGDTVPLSSIYRSLAVLEEAGVISPHYSTKGVTRYELAEWLMGHHHHLVCLECGEVEDIEIGEEIEVQLEAIVESIGRDVSFTPRDHALEIEGLCARCN